jgi:hypothetical protein
MSLAPALQVNRLNGDAKPVSVIGELKVPAEIKMADGSSRPVLDTDENGDNVLRTDPTGHGIVEYENGVTAYMLNSGRGFEIEAICERGIVTAWNDGETWRLREPRGIHQLDESQRQRWCVP